MSRHLRCIAARIVFLTMTSLVLAACAKKEDLGRRGAFAFHYEPHLTQDDLESYSRFDLLVTHDPLPPNQVEILRKAGTKLLLYEWAVAFYDSRASEWQRSLVAGSGKALLNREPLTGGIGSPEAGAWYFDPASVEHTDERAAELAHHIRSLGYDGVFLDTTTAESVHPVALAEYERRHPDTPYDVFFAKFLIRLRSELPAGIVFTNQGYRKPERYLPHVDWDLTESLITRPHNGSWEPRPWNDPDDPWNSIHYLMTNVLEPLRSRYPRVRFAHLNYAEEPRPETIHLVVAVAQLFGDEGFVATPAIVGRPDPIYFREPGEPTSDRIDHEEGTGAHRFFENGLIAVTAAPRPVTIEIPPGPGFRNRITGDLACGESITLPATDGLPRAWFFDADDECEERR